MKLKIGDILYKGNFSGIFDYEVTGIRERQNYKEYEARCKQCKGHVDCVILLSDDLKYLETINEDDDHLSYHYYHNTDKGYNFYRTEKEAALNLLDIRIADAEKEVSNKQKALDSAKKYLAEAIAKKAELGVMAA